MGMKVSFELSDKDLGYFRQHLQRVRKAHVDEKLVVAGARELVAEALAGDVPEFVSERIEKLGQLIAMLEDGQWRLVGRDRVRILDALTYFVDPEDLIPDRVPGIGYLDDAIMVELVCQELRHEIDAYEDFCNFRDARPKDDDAARLDKRRISLQTRMRRRRRTERSARAARGLRKSPIGLW